MRNICHCRRSKDLLVEDLRTKSFQRSIGRKARSDERLRRLPLGAQLVPEHSEEVKATN